MGEHSLNGKIKEEEVVKKLIGINKEIYLKF
jgi:hypothetical protein